jgi:hypothetical protein
VIWSYEVSIHPRKRRKPRRTVEPFDLCCTLSLFDEQENLILVDPDFFHDYSPYPALPDLRLPAGYASVHTPTAYAQCLHCSIKIDTYFARQHCPS